MIESNESRIQWALRVLLLAVMGTLLLSSKVWLSERNFPVISFMKGMPQIPYPLDYILYCVLIVLIIYQIIYLPSKNTMYALLGLYSFLMLGDQMRWQPYNTQYLLMLFGLLFYQKNPEMVLNTFRLIIVTFFIWSGFQELNPIFSVHIFPWLVGPIAVKFPFGMENWILENGYLFAALNIVAGIGLLFEKTRNYAVYLAMIIQVFLLYSLSPLANDWNHVIMPFNAAMAFFCFVLFYDTHFEIKEMVWSKKFRYQQITLVLFTILPLLSFSGYYDRMQSFNAYSGKGWYAKIYVTEELVEKLPDGIKRYVNRPAMSEPYIETTNWSMGALNVSPYSEKRVYERLRDYICSFSENECPARLQIYTYADSQN